MFSLIPISTAFLLAGCAWNNRRNGYRRRRESVAPVEDFVFWLAALTAAIRSGMPDQRSRALTFPVRYLPEVNSNDIIRLNAELERNQRAAEPAVFDAVLVSTVPAGISEDRRVP